MTTSNLISIEGGSKTYRFGDVETRAMRGLDLKIQNKEFVAVMGPSGCGKSTLLNVLGMLDVLDDGAYYFDGEKVTGRTEAGLAKHRRNKIGYIFQNFNLINSLSAQKNIKLALRYSGLPKDQQNERARVTLEKVGLSHRAAHKPSKLSGGERQRVAIARAIATKPSLILADEPTGNLDSERSVDVMRLLGSLNNEGATIVMVTHSEEDATHASRVIMMKDGQLVSA